MCRADLPRPQELTRFSSRINLAVPRVVCVLSLMRSVLVASPWRPVASPERLGYVSRRECDEKDRARPGGAESSGLDGGTVFLWYLHSIFFFCMECI